MSRFSDIESDYLDYCQNFLKRSPQTIKGMKSSFHVFREYFEDLPVEDFKLEDILLYCEWLTGRKGHGGHYSSSALCQRIGHLKALFRFCEERRGLNVFNWRLIPVPKNNKRRLEFLTREEFSFIISRLKVKNFETLRLKACLYVLVSTGCRASEFTSMQMSDVNLETREVFIPHGKGDKPGVVFLSREALFWLGLYLREREKVACKTCKWVWVTVLPGYCAPLSCSSLQHQMWALGRKIRFHKKLYPHLFRHTFATNLLRNGANIREVQELLRHKSLEATMIYTHVTNNDLRLAHERYLRI